MLWWLQISIKDIIDILLLAVCLYYTYVTLRYSGSRSLFMGIVTFIILWLLISQVLQVCEHRLPPTRHYLPGRGS